MVETDKYLISSIYISYVAIQNENFIWLNNFNCIPDMSSLQLFRILSFNQNYLKGSTFGRYIGKPNYVTEIYCNTFKCFRVNQSAISQFICYRPVQHKIYKLMKLNICQFLPLSDLDFRTVLTVWINAFLEKVRSYSVKSILCMIYASSAICCTCSF
jgi:hypothetical protein